ncbi:MAG: ABC transporter transmembrane domain-containing protein [Firmicutes bacterium]|nr:ABC transporter transmembrane domain-containing protein [Bacillota bacterium]
MFTVLYKLRWFFYEHWKRYAVALGLLLLLNFVEVIPPDLIGRVIDQLNDGSITASSLLHTLLLYGGVIIVGYVAGYLWMVRLFGGSNLLQLTLRSRLMRHFLRMTPTFYETNRTGDLMARATNDLNAVSQTAGFGILTLIDSTTFSATILITMGVLISWKLTLLSLAPLPLIALAMTKYGRVVHERFTLAQDAFGDMNDRVLETIAGVRVVRAYVQESAQERQFAAVTQDVYQKNADVARIDAQFEPTIKILVGVSYLIGLGYGAYMVFQSQLTLGQLTSFNVYLGMLIWPMLAIGQLINIMQRGNASLDRVTETLSREPDVADPPQVERLVSPVTITFHDYSFRYPLSAVDNLQDVSITIHKGQTLGIVGRTGAGKSTLLRQLLREYPVGHGGSLSIDGVPIERLAVEQVTSWLGYVPQDPQLFSRSIADNIRFGVPEASDEKVAATLIITSLHEDTQQFPEGLATMVGEKGVSLSGGQKQRVALARALLCDPEILMLDDALSAVDARTEAYIVGEIRQLRQARTTLIATHRVATIAHADWILVLEEGRIVEQGTHVDLLAQQGWYYEQYVRQRLEDNTDGAGVTTSREKRVWA